MRRCVPTFSGSPQTERASEQKRRRRGREAVAMPRVRKRARVDDGQEQNGEKEVGKHSSPSSRLWEHCARITSLLMPAAFARCYRVFGRYDHAQQLQREGAPSSIPNGGRGSDENKYKDRNKSVDHAKQQEEQQQEETPSSIPKRKRTSDENKYEDRNEYIDQVKQRQQQQPEQTPSSIARRRRVSNEDRNKYIDQVILGDCLEYVQKMPPGILSCTITCPPSNTRVIKNEDSVEWLEFVNKQMSLLEQLYRVTKPGGHLWYVHKVQYYKNDVLHPVSWLLKSPWKVRQEIIWDRLETPDKSNKNFWPIDRRIFWLRKEPGPQFFLSNLVFKWGNIWRWKSSDHHSFPIFLALAILHASNLSKNSLVFDPYGRCGSVAKACQMLKRQFLITETDESKVKAINHRLNETTPEDKHWKSLISKQITNQSLNLSMNPES